MWAQGHQHGQRAEGVCGPRASQLSVGGRAAVRSRRQVEGKQCKDDATIMVLVSKHAEIWKRAERNAAFLTICNFNSKNTQQPAALRLIQLLGAQLDNGADSCNAEAQEAVLNSISACEK